MTESVWASAVRLMNENRSKKLTENVQLEIAANEMWEKHLQSAVISALNTYESVEDRINKLLSQ